MLTAIVRFKILEQAHGQSPFRFTVADLDRPVRAKRLDGREILPVYWRLSREEKGDAAQKGNNELRPLLFSFNHLMALVEKYPTSWFRTRQQKTLGWSKSKPQH